MYEYCRVAEKISIVVSIDVIIIITIIIIIRNVFRGLRRLRNLPWCSSSTLSSSSSLVRGPHIRPPRLLMTLYLRLLPRRRLPPRRRRLGCRIGPSGSST